MALAEMNTKEIIDNGMIEKEFIDFNLVQEKPVEENIDKRKGIDLYLSSVGWSVRHSYVGY